MIDYLNKHLVGYIQIASLFASLFVLCSPIDLPGCQFYFLIPLSYCLMTFHCKEIFAYHHNSFGLKCFYGVSFIKYIILPCYVCCLNGQGFLFTCSSSAYQYAILVTSMEIIVAMLVIKHWFPVSFKRQHYVMQRQKSYYSDLSVGGLVFVILLGFVLFMRGHMTAVISGIRFLVVSSKFDKNADFWTYEIWAVQLMLAFFTIVITSYYQKKEDINVSASHIIFPIVMVFFSCTLILTNNRMTMVYYALSGMCILNYAFPKRKKLITTSIMMSLLVVIISFTLIKNYSIDISSNTDATVSSTDGIADLDAYVCGINSVAHSYENFLLNGDKFSFNNVIAEILRFAMPMRLPGMLPSSYANYPTTIDLATTGSEMVPVAGETLFWGGLALGWVIDAIVVFLIVRILIHYDIKTKLSKDLGKKYIYSWMSILFGIFMCYAVQTLWNNATYMPLYLTFVLFINRTFRKNNTQIKKMLHI